MIKIKMFRKITNGRYRSGTILKLGFKYNGFYFCVSDFVSLKIVSLKLACPRKSPQYVKVVSGSKR